MCYNRENLRTERDMFVFWYKYFFIRFGFLIHYLSFSHIFDRLLLRNILKPNTFNMSCCNPISIVYLKFKANIRLKEFQLRSLQPINFVERLTSSLLSTD